MQFIIIYNDVGVERVGYWWCSHSSCEMSSVKGERVERKTARFFVSALHPVAGRRSLRESSGVIFPQGNDDEDNGKVFKTEL